MTVFLRNVRLESRDGENRFPFDLPVVRSLSEELAFSSPVTFLVGDNGSGKSTLLEAIAVKAGCVAVGSADLERDPSLEAARRLAGSLVLTKIAQPRVKLFFRAEDAFGFVRRVEAEAAALEALEVDFREQFDDGSWAQQLAMGTARGQRSALEQRYGEEPDARSHGESFLHLLQERVRPKGLYLLDEPESPLSPLRVIALLSMLIQSTAEGSQFLIATHSPILMALPGADILVLDSGRLKKTLFDEVEHVELTRSFLQDPERFLRRL
jgi:predicted ATPase